MTLKLRVFWPFWDWGTEFSDEKNLKLNPKLMQSDTVSLVTLVPADNMLIKNVPRASPQNGRCLQMGSGQYCFWELRNLVCIQLTNYSANYTLGKLNPGAKDFITSIATNIVLGYKLPGSLDPVTFYFDISNRFIICSGKKSSFS